MIDKLNQKEIIYSPHEIRPHELTSNGRRTPGFIGGNKRSSREECTMGDHCVDRVVAGIDFSFSLGFGRKILYRCSNEVISRGGRDGSRRWHEEGNRFDHKTGIPCLATRSLIANGHGSERLWLVGVRRNTIWEEGGWIICLQTCVYGICLTLIIHRCIALQRQTHNFDGCRVTADIDWLLAVDHRIRDPGKTPTGRAYCRFSNGEPTKAQRYKATPW